MVKRKRLAVLLVMLLAATALPVAMGRDAMLVNLQCFGQWVYKAAGDARTTEARLNDLQLRGGRYPEMEP